LMPLSDFVVVRRPACDAWYVPQILQMTFDYPMTYVIYISGGWLATGPGLVPWPPG